jgi:hypothetical protein
MFVDPYEGRPFDNYGQTLAIFQYFAVKYIMLFVELIF